MPRLNYEEFTTGLLSPVSNETINRLGSSTTHSLLSLLADCCQLCDAPKKEIFYGKSKPSDSDEFLAMKNTLRELAVRTSGRDGVVHPSDFSKLPEEHRALVINRLHRIHCVMGILGEVAELFFDDLFRTHEMFEELRESGRIEEAAAVAQVHTNSTTSAEELGDIGFYFAALCSLYGFTLEEVIDKNINKLITRYPEGKFNLNDSLNRDKNQEYEAMDSGTDKSRGKLPVPDSIPTPVISSTPELDEIEQRYRTEPKMFMEYSMVYREPILALVETIRVLTRQLENASEERTRLLAELSSAKALLEGIPYGDKDRKTPKPKFDFPQDDID